MIDLHFVFHNNFSLIFADDSGIDWPLVLGSFSAGVLFLTSVIVVAVVVHRRGTSLVILRQKKHISFVMVSCLCQMCNFLFLLFVIFQVKAAAKEKKRRYRLSTFHYYHYDYYYQELNDWSWRPCLVPVWMSSCVYLYAGSATATSPVIQCCCDNCRAITSTATYSNTNIQICSWRLLW